MRTGSVGGKMVSDGLKDFVEVRTSTAQQKYWCLRFPNFRQF